MSADFVDDLVQAVKRVLEPDIARLKEVLIISGMPEETQNLRYLGFNRQCVHKETVTIFFSAVAIINNRRMTVWQHKGYMKTISQFVFNPRWTRNELDLFINALRCSPEIIDLIAGSGAPYSLLGILEIEDRNNAGIFKRWSRRIRPVLAIPGIEAPRINTVTAFEKANEIRKRAKRKSM